MLYNKHNFAVAKFTSKMGIRPEINGVFFKQDKTVATDSFRLMEMSTPGDVKPEDYPEVQGKSILRGCKPFIVNATGLKNIKFPKHNNALPILDNAGIKHIDKDVVEFISTDLETINSVTARRVEGEFPKYEAIIPTGKPVLEISVNGRYLAEMLMVLSKLNTDEDVKMTFYGDKKPVVLEASTQTGEQKGRGLLMPISK